MSPVTAPSLPSRVPVLGALMLSLMLAGCATRGPTPDGISDPLEPVNRAVHGFNKGMDRVLFRPGSLVYGTVLPSPVRAGVKNFSYNLGAPQDAVNSFLQGNLENGLHNTFRFLLNSTLGVAGIFDPATSFGLERRDTDFGETLHVWGTGEGAYVALPVLGPSTTRDATGRVVDFFTDPFAPFLNYPEKVLPTAAWILDNAGDRYTFTDTVDTVLYDSADSYAQTRLIYLENRRFELGQAAGDVYADPYIDPYDDLFAE